MARKFFFVAAGLLMLALSYHFGAGTSLAQSAGGAAVALASEPAGGYMLALASNGDVYRAQAGTRTYNFELVGNIFSGAPTPALRQSWGQVKARYQTPAGGSVAPGAQDR